MNSPLVLDGSYYCIETDDEPNIVCALILNEPNYMSKFA